MRYDSIVIGAGLSGLTSALLLARSGRRVLLVEQHSQPAPVVRGFSRQGQYFDSGFHYVGGLGEGGAFRPLLRHLRLDAELELFPFAAQGFDSLQIAATAERFSLPVGFAAIRAELTARFPAVRAGIERYLDEVSRQWNCFPYLDLNVDIADFGIASVHGRSLKERLQEFSDYPQLQSLLSMHSLLYGVAPTDASATLNAQVAGSYYHSVHGIVGGGRALVAALLKLLQAAGVEIRCCAEVGALLSSGSAVTGVRLVAGEEILAKEVIATLNPALLPQLLRLLPQGVLRPAYLKRLNNLRQTPSAYILFARSRRPLDFLHRRNLFVQQRPGIFSAATELPLEERSFYLTGADQGQGKTDGLIGIVPASYAEVAAFAAAGTQRCRGYAEYKQRLEQRLLNIFAKNCPQLAELEPLALATPLTLRDYSLAPQGAIYGVGRFIGQYNPHPVTRLSGLYLSGQAIAAPGWLGAVVASYLTCGSILGHQQLRGEIKACR